ncbi:MAG: hypothetical protein HGA19_12800 [Oscillochloris sp.]|nr:hypothetical protein [Oscillochloris sp.]
MQISIHPPSAALSITALSIARRLFASMRLVPLWTIIRLSLYLITIGEILTGLALGARSAGAVNARHSRLFQSQNALAATSDIHAWPSIIVIDGLGHDEGAPQQLIGRAYDRFVPYYQGGM